MQINILTIFKFADKHIDYIYDVTVAYPDNIPENESDLLFGRMPYQINFHVRRHTVPEENLEKWLQNLWLEKEAWLREFYNNKSFRNSLIANANSLGYRCKQAYLCIIWSLLVGVMLTLLTAIPLVRWCLAFWISFHLVANRFGGLDLLQTNFFSRWIK